MKLTNAWIEEIEINGKGYAVMVLERDKEYEVYLERAGYAMRYMFGLEKQTNTLQETMETAIANAPDYVYMFDEE